VTPPPADPARAHPRDSIEKRQQVGAGDAGGGEIALLLLQRQDLLLDGTVERVGAVAQLGERLNRTQEADGSIPFSSTD
jgi:hypothetical protein